MNVQNHDGPCLSRAAFLRGVVGLVGASLATSMQTRTIGAAQLSRGALMRPAAADDEGEDSVIVYFGTGAMGKGIHTFALNRRTGFLTARDLVEAPAPGWITLDPTERLLYAATGDRAIASYRIDNASGSLTPLNTQSTGSGVDAHITVDPSGSFVIGASYDAGSVSVLPIQADGTVGSPTMVIEHHGEPGPHPNQTQAHAHMAAFDTSGRWLTVTDLGLDRLYVYQLDATHGTLAPGSTPYLQFQRGRGPRHIAFHPSGRFAYVINELSSIMTALTLDPANGVFEEIQAESTLPDGWTGRKQSAEVVVHPSGRFVYGSNRGSGGDSDDIVMFEIDPSTGRMTLGSHTPTLGRVPRNINIEPSGRLLVCPHQDSNDVVTFAIEPATGALTPIGQNVEVANAICTQFRHGQ